MRKIIAVDEAIKEKADSEAKRFKKTQKQYVEECLQFFMSRGIDPGTYEPDLKNQLLDLVEDNDKKMMEFMEYTVDRLFRYIVQQERTLLTETYTEALSSRIFAQMILNKHLDKIEDPIEYKKEFEKNRKYFQDAKTKAQDLLNQKIKKHSNEDKKVRVIKEK